MPNKGATLYLSNHQNGQIQLGHSLPLLIAIILSSLAHLYLFNQPITDYLQLFKTPPKHKSVVIQAKLVKQPPPKVIPKPVPQPKAKPKPTPKPLKKVAKKQPVAIKPQPKVMALPRIAPKPSTFKLPPLSDAPVADTPAFDGDALANRASQAEPVVEPVIAPLIKPAPTIETAETAIVTFAPEPELVPYRHIESHYDVYVDPVSNANRSAAGEATMVFSSDGDHYQLKSVIEPHGLIALFVPDLVQTSQGLIGEAGLQPIEYLHKLGSKKKKTRKAVFDWADNQLKMETVNGTQTAAVKPGAQDLLSFMYQFMYAPPLGHTQMTVTNGRKVSTYHYSFEGEVLVKTKVGLIKTVHILRTDAAQEDKTELWLAVDYRYLPVKIKKTEQKKHKVYELVARSISTDQGSLTASDTQTGIAVADTADDDTVQTTDQRSDTVEQNTQAPTQLNPFLNR